MFAHRIRDNESNHTLPSFTFSLSEPSIGIASVRDFCFLGGYFEPTLLVLHESPVPTWAGYSQFSLAVVIVAKDAFQLSRTRVEQLFCLLILLNRLNLSYGVWTNFLTTALRHCPFLVHLVVPLSYQQVTFFLGGAIAFSPNSVLYLNQNYRYGLALNDFADLNANVFVNRGQ